MHTNTIALTTAALGFLTPLAHAAPDANGYTWANITHAGNRNTNASETPFRPDLQIGAVNYEFRMATTEVTVGQWFEFVQAYSPYYDFAGGGIAGRDFTSHGVNFGFDGLYLVPGYSVNRAADMSWEYAARYANWLHNGKASGQWAFESGAYDTSTFTYNPDGSANHQVTRSDGAKYWIPSLNEWTKAAYFDPNRYGEGKEGYWLYPNGSNTQSVGNILPDDGGERNAGHVLSPVWPLDVGLFGHVQSPFGLLDAGGGVREWLEDASDDGNRSRITRGTDYGEFWTDDPFNYDKLEFFRSSRLDFSSNQLGLRLASIPSPMTVALFAAFCSIGSFRMRM